MSGYKLTSVKQVEEAALHTAGGTHRLVDPDRYLFFALRYEDATGDGQAIATVCTVSRELYEDAPDAVPGMLEELGRDAVKRFLDGEGG